MPDAQDRFTESLQAAAPPEDFSTPLKALWHAAKDDWDTAHTLVQADESKEAAWVHAHLHRIEGDLDNAGYWYRRAGRPECINSMAQERATIANECITVKMDHLK